MTTFDQQVDRKGTACIKWDFQEMDYGTSGLIPFSIADADWAVHTPILEALKKRIDNGVIGYTDLENAYFEAVAGWTQRRHDWKIEHSWIVPTGGIVPAMSNAIEALTSAGAGIIVQPPVYDPFYSIINATGRTILKNDLVLDENGYHMDFADLEEKCRDGAQMVLFTTGRGTPFGCPVPTVKISSNTALYNKKRRWIDFDAGRLLSGMPMETLAEEFFSYVLDLSSGRIRAKSESLDRHDLAIFKDGVTL